MIDQQEFHVRHENVSQNVAKSAEDEMDEIINQQSTSIKNKNKTKKSKKNAVEENEIIIENNENIENTIADDSEFRLMSKAEKRKLKKSAGKNSEQKASEKELGIEPINGNHISDNCNNDDNFQIESKAEKKKKKKLNERKFGETENKSEKLEASRVDQDRESQDEGLEVLEKDSGVKTDDILKNEDTLPALSKSQKKKKKKAAQKAAQDQNLDNNQEISESKLHAEKITPANDENDPISEKVGIESATDKLDATQAQPASAKSKGKKAAKAPPKSAAARLLLQRREMEEKRNKQMQLEAEEEERREKLRAEEEERKRLEREKQKAEKKIADKAAKDQQKIDDEKNKLKEKQNRLLQGQNVVSTHKPQKAKVFEFDDSEIYSAEKLSQISGLKINSKYRSPIVCVLGHVDTGKTKILDHLRCTKVQDNEAGGITQQIGSTNVSAINVQNLIKNTPFGRSKSLFLPGILLIDTPGHETFSNLRLRGSSMCDIGVLVVDITHGLEPQTKESIGILKRSKTPFIVALNKVDKLFGWKKLPDSEIVTSIQKQDVQTKSDFEDRFGQIFSEFAELGLNIALCYDHQALSQGTDMIPVVPTSAHSGEGLPDLMGLICMLSQTALRKKILYRNEPPEAIIMEAKRIQGYGMTLDVVLINGQLSEGDTVVVIENFQPKVTKIKFILVPPTMAETRTKVQLKQVPAIQGTRGIKITLQSSESCDNLMIGFPMPVAKNPSEEKIAEMIEELDFKKHLAGVGGFSNPGVHVQASTVGSLEALLAFLKASKIPYMGVNIGDVFKRDVMKASTMLESSPMYAVVLAFDVKIDKEAQDYAKANGVKIFSANIIYHLYDQFTNYVLEYREKEKRDNFENAIFPCIIKIIPSYVFNIKDPLVAGVLVEEGEIRTSTKLRVFTDKENFELGQIVSIEKDKKNVPSAKAGDEVSIKVLKSDGSQKMFGRHYNAESTIVSDLTRESIDVLKDFYRSEMSKEMWMLTKRLKEKLKIL